MNKHIGSIVINRLLVIVNFRSALTSLLLCLALFGCVPLGNQTFKVVTRGEKAGARVESRLVHHYLFALVSPDGGGKTYYNRTEHWLVDGKKELPLRFLDSDNNDSQYMKEMLGVADSELWVAFWLIEQKHFQASLRIDVFDGTSIRHSMRLDGAVVAYITGPSSRDDYFNKIVDYSIQPMPGNALIRINTKSGIVTYDVKNNILKQEGKRSETASSASETPEDQDWNLEKIKQAAERGDAKAQFKLGQMYSSGFRVSRDFSEALTWYRKAAALGNEDAEFVLKSLEDMKKNAIQHGR